MYTDTLNPEFAINYWLFGGYGVIALLLSTLLTRTLFTNGSIFLKEVFGSDSELSKSVNHLLAVGFFMFHLGWALMYMNPVGTESPGEAFGLVVKRLALLLIMSGILHGANMVVLFSIWCRGLEPNPHLGLVRTSNNQTSNTARSFHHPSHNRADL